MRHTPTGARGDPRSSKKRGAKAKATKLLHNAGSETQFNDDTTIALDENNAALLEITISGTLSTKGIDNENEANNLKSTGNYKVFFNDAVPSYVTAITDTEDPNKLKFQSLAEGWNFELENNPYPKDNNTFKNLFKFEDTGTGFSYKDYTNSEKKIQFGLDPSQNIQASAIFQAKDDISNSKTVKATYAKIKNSSDENISY